MRLALALGYPSPRAMLKEMTSSELSDWMAFYRIEPFGCHAEDRRSAQIVNMLYDINKKKGASSLKLEEILINFVHAIKEESTKSLAAKLRAWASASKKGKK